MLLALCANIAVAICECCWFCVIQSVSPLLHMLQLQHPHSFSKEGDSTGSNLGDCYNRFALLEKNLAGGNPLSSFFSSHPSIK